MMSEGPRMKKGYPRIRTKLRNSLWESSRTLLEVISLEVSTSTLVRTSMVLDSKLQHSGIKWIYIDVMIIALTGPCTP